MDVDILVPLRCLDVCKVLHSERLLQLRLHPLRAPNTIVTSEGLPLYMFGLVNFGIVCLRLIWIWTTDKKISS